MILRLVLVEAEAKKYHDFRQQAWKTFLLQQAMNYSFCHVYLHSFSYCFSFEFHVSWWIVFWHEQLIQKGFIAVSPVWPKCTIFSKERKYECFKDTYCWLSISTLHKFLISCGPICVFFNSKQSSVWGSRIPRAANFIRFKIGEMFQF